MEQFLIFSPIEIILAGATTFLFLLVLLYLLIVFTRPRRFLKKQSVTDEEKKQLPVSVIIYACGQTESLRDNLPAFLSQDYPDYEVIVANDGSDSDSDELLRTIEQSESRLYHTNIPDETRYLSRKKLALTLAVKAAKHEILLFTEADCAPASEHWISEMCGDYDDKTSLVLGFSRYSSGKGFFNKLVAYDNLLNAVRQFASAIKHKTYAGNGRNLSYRKSLFFKHKGYYQSLNLHAGADDLFVNEASTRENTRVMLQADSFTEYHDMEAVTFKDINIGRMATEKYYRGVSLTFHRFFTFLGVLLFPAVAVLTLVIGLFGNWMISIWAGLLLVIRFVVKAILLHRNARLFGQKPHTFWLIIFDWYHPLYDFYLHLYHQSKKKNDYTFVINDKY